MVVRTAGYTISSCGAAYQVSNHAHIKIHIMADILMVRCFPHVINLACKAVLAAVTKTDLAKETAEDHIPNPTGRASPPWHFQDTLKRDPITSLHSLICNVCICHCNSHLLIYSQVQFRFEGPHFAEHTSRKLALHEKNLGLLHDVDTRWSSTLLMIERAQLLHQVYLQSLVQY